MKKLPEEAIIQGIREGNLRTIDTVLKQIYHQYYHRVEHFILKNKGTEEDAKDLFQDSIIVLYNRIKQDESPLRSKIWTYLYSVCRNLWYKKLRNLGKEIPVAIHTDILPDLNNQIAILEQKENQVRLHGLIDQLSDACRTILLQYYFERLSMKIIAREMKFANAQVAKNKKYHCLKHLKELALTLWKK